MPASDNIFRHEYFALNYNRLNPAWVLVLCQLSFPQKTAQPGVIGVWSSPSPRTQPSPHDQEKLGRHSLVKAYHPLRAEVDAAYLRQRAEPRNP